MSSPGTPRSSPSEPSTNLKPSSDDDDKNTALECSSARTQVSIDILDVAVSPTAQSQETMLSPNDLPFSEMPMLRVADHNQTCEGEIDLRLTEPLHPGDLNPTRLFLSADKQIENELLIKAENEWIRNQTGGPPWKLIVFSIILVALGSLFLALTVLIFTDVIVYEKLYAITPYALAVLGVLCLIPGVYHLQIAARAAAGERNISWDDLRN